MKPRGINVAGCAKVGAAADEIDNVVGPRSSLSTKMSRGAGQPTSRRPGPSVAERVGRAVPGATFNSRHFEQQINRTVDI
jgi:hypothetical protein